ncbi:Titin-like protein [Frankliniella fusca]|uniref:Titin-like protein n=1 Tax=Frankliniella fusca TaxID=407009 RepID=A0AAE1LM02_9NEOP|nr:Titin-like protein [Frankliniella fusca]
MVAHRCAWSVHPDLANAMCFPGPELSSDAEVPDINIDVSDGLDTDCWDSGFFLEMTEKFDLDLPQVMKIESHHDDAILDSRGSRGSMQKVPSLSDLSDPESSLGWGILRHPPIRA